MGNGISGGQNNKGISAETLKVINTQGYIQ